MSSPEHDQQQPNAALQWAQQHPMPPQRVSSQLTGGATSQQQRSSEEYYRQMMVAQGKLPEQQRASMAAPNIERPNSQPQEQRVSIVPLPPPNIGSEQSRPSQQFVMAQERIPVDVMRQPSVAVQRMSQQLAPPAGYVFSTVSFPIS
jgi:hypothetical protein